MWYEGVLRVGESFFYYCYKQYDECSEYGINGGRISKLMIKRNGEVVCNYDRGWDLEPIDQDTEIALNILLRNN